jgi:Asp-tRNA(Asn)/Glu-tRNA(Gln) amidotransferase A subunit family amidase
VPAAGSGAEKWRRPRHRRSRGAISDAAELTRAINAWKGRWPLNTYRDRDASKLSGSALERLAMAEAMTLADYGTAIARRQRNRETHARLAARYDAAITFASAGEDARLCGIAAAIRDLLAVAR